MLHHELKKESFVPDISVPRFQSSDDDAMDVDRLLRDKGKGKEVLPDNRAHQNLPTPLTSVVPFFSLHPPLSVLTALLASTDYSNSAQKRRRRRQRDRRPHHPRPNTSTHLSRTGNARYRSICCSSKIKVKSSVAIAVASVVFGSRQTLETSSRRR